MVVTRFPPSPTGFLHVGGLRTALYNFLYARKNSGRFLLRIEDTDQKREVKGAVESLIRTLHWAGLTWDEGPDIGGPHGPYVQSERIELYKIHADELVAKGHAYFCFCTPERLTEMRSRQEAEKKAPMYDRTCLKLSLDEIEQRKKNGEKCVIRQKIPDQENVVFEDLIRGEVSFLCSIIDDQVLMKSDGFPTYHLANVVDDHLMEVTHVIRGEEWLSSAPKHVLLYEAFGWAKPFFAHIPLLLNKDKSKLSKRQNDVAVEDYISKGYSREAVLNFIALLGWHPGGTDQEIFSMEEMLKLFSLEKVHKSGAVFDTEKLDWMNWQWRRKRFDEDVRPENEKLFELAKSYLEPAWSTNRMFLDRVLKTIKEKIIKNPAETAAHCAFYFKDSVSFTDELLINPKMKVTNEIAKTALEAAHKTLQNLESFDDESKIQEVLGKVVADLELKNGQVLWPVRVVLTGEQYSPGVFEVLWGLGKEKALKRIADGLKKL